MNKLKEFKIGDKVKMSNGSAVKAKGIIKSVGTGIFGEPEYSFVDEETGYLIMSDPRSLELIEDESKTITVAKESRRR